MTTDLIHAIRIVMLPGSKSTGMWLTRGDVAALLSQIEGATEAAPARQPLTDEQLAYAWASITDPLGLHAHLPTPVAVRDFARAIERAHGIGGAA